MATKNIPFFAKENQYKNLKVKMKSGPDVILKQEIGQGAFSNVYSTSNEHLVAKIMNLAFEPALLSFTQEKKFLEQLDKHDHLIEFASAQKIQINQGSFGILLIENCPKGSLVEIMEKSPKQQLSEQQILRVLYEVSLGLQHIHYKKFAHRDIKIENILFAEDGKFKICDFGSMTENLVQRIGDMNIQELEDEVKRNTTPMYRAPEQSEPSLFRDWPLAEKVDIFALGVMGYILCYKKPPFESALGAISCSTYWPDLPVTTEEFQTLLKKMLSPNPNDRPSAKEVGEIIINDMKFDYENEGIVDKVIFKKGNDKEAKPSFFSKFEKMIVGAFYDTQGWIKGALLYDEYGPKQKYVRKLLLKAWQKREKTDKFYVLLYNTWTKESKLNTIANLKILILLHNYFKKGPPEAMFSKSSRKIKPNMILQEILQTWEKILTDTHAVNNNNSDQKRSTFSSKLIVNMSKLLQAKLKLNEQYSTYIEGNFSLNPFLQSVSGNFKSLDPQMLFDLFDYLGNLLRFTASNLLQVGHLWNIQACIALSVLDEMYCLICLIVHLYHTFKVSTNFESQKFDSSLIIPFVTEQDSRFAKMYGQVSKFAKRCSQITETATQVASVIPRLSPDVITFICEDQILTNQQHQFNIFEYLNYNVNILGLKLPLSYGPVVLEATKQSISSQQFVSQESQQNKKIPVKKISNATKPKSAADNINIQLGLHDDFDIPINQSGENDDIIRDFQRAQQNQQKKEIINQKRNTQNKQEMVYLDSKLPNNNNVVVSRDIFSEVFEKKISNGDNERAAESVFNEFGQFQVAPPYQQQQQQQIPVDFFDGYEDGKVLTAEEQQKQNYAFDTSHPSLIRPDKQPDNWKIPNDTKRSLFDANDLSRSISKHRNNKAQENIYDFFNQGNVQKNDSQQSNSNPIPQYDQKMQANGGTNFNGESFNPFDSVYGEALGQNPISQQHPIQGDVNMQNDPYFYQNNNEAFGDALLQEQRKLFEQQVSLHQQQQQQQQQQQSQQQQQQQQQPQQQQQLVQSEQYQLQWLFQQQQQAGQTNFQQQTQMIAQQNFSNNSQQINGSINQTNGVAGISQQQQQQMQQQQQQQQQFQQNYHNNNLYYQQPPDIPLNYQQNSQQFQAQQQQQQQGQFNQYQQFNQQPYDQQYQQQQMQQQSPQMIAQQPQPQQAANFNYNYSNSYEQNMQLIAQSSQKPQVNQNGNVTHWIQDENAPQQQQEQKQQQQQNNSDKENQLLVEQQLLWDMLANKKQSNQDKSSSSSQQTIKNQNDQVQEQKIPQQQQNQEQIIPQQYQQQQQQILPNENNNTQAKVPLSEKTNTVQHQQQQQPFNPDGNHNCNFTEGTTKQSTSFDEQQGKDCENVPDDDAIAKLPLDSVVGNSLKPAHLQQGMSAAEQVKSNGQIENAERKRQQFQEMFSNQSQLIKYIHDAVSSEFYEFIVDFSEIKIGGSIGSGNSCQVYRGECKGKDVAVKVIKLDSSDELHLKEFQREIQALIQLKNHPNLLQLVSISSSDNNFYILTEFCQGGTLFDLLHKKKKEIRFIPWLHRLIWLQHVCYGMSYLHKSKLIHRDLKSLNLLFDTVYDPKSVNVPIMKIADFGLTRSGSYTNNPHLSGAIGTFHWMAPETIMNQPSTNKSDVYSFSIVMWELCTRNTPYKEFKTTAYILRYVTDQKGRPDLNLMPFDTPQGLKELMIKCWDEDPKQRPDFDQLIEALNNIIKVNFS